MKLSQQAITDFKAIYFQEYDILLSDEEANQKGIELLQFFALIKQCLEEASNA